MIDTDYPIGFRSKQRICFCLPENANTCPMRKDRDCEQGILNISFEKLTPEEVNIITTLSSINDSVKDTLARVRNSTERISKNFSDIHRNLTKIKRKTR